MSTLRKENRIAKDINLVYDLSEKPNLKPIKKRNEDRCRDLKTQS